MMRRRNCHLDPFRFAGVFAAKLELEDWTYAGRAATSRRTITASINPSGLRKIQDNWIYKTSEQAQIDGAVPPIELA